MKKSFFLVLMTAFLGLNVAAQNKYIVKTKGTNKTTNQQMEALSEDEDEAEKLDIISRNFVFSDLCSWQEGMRFMVVPEKKDLIIKTFTDSLTGNMVSSNLLKHKIMVYKGHDKLSGLHEHINFLCEDDGKVYYYEIPSYSFDDYCYSRQGVPTLAYLGDVDKAIELFKDKKFRTKANTYYVDSELEGNDVEAVTDVPVGTEVTVKAIGVGSRSYPVKIIVADRRGREFFQNVAISRINSGMRDDEFTAIQEIPHTFKGSFELVNDNMTDDKEYGEYRGKVVYTLQRTDMTDSHKLRVRMARLSVFTIADVQKMPNSKYVRLTLTGTGSGSKYYKLVTMDSENNVTWDEDMDAPREDVYSNLFAEGDPSKYPGIRKKNYMDIQKGIVRKGFTEQEVKLALGEPDVKGTDKNGVFTYTYNSTASQSRSEVFFDSATKTVLRVVK
ncbi:hypothetical protein [Xylanibacter brevis]|uniref:hypothetical protein n=1 Tax=Xylanibacter brevis TaxID=83231 RepID=UPI00047F24DC|nr:hypothetical protein [Xylanibacter brevis]